MDTKPVRNLAAYLSLQNAIAHLMLASLQFANKDQTEQETAADILLDSACNLRKQVTK
jgi:hypothetical protein